MSDKRMRLGNDSTTVDFQTNGKIIIDDPVYGSTLPTEGEDGQVFYKLGEEETQNWLTEEVDGEYWISKAGTSGNASIKAWDHNNGASLGIRAGDKASLWTDSEGGNIRIVSPNGQYIYDVDAYDNTFLRLFASADGGASVKHDWCFNASDGTLYLKGIVGRDGNMWATRQNAGETIVGVDGPNGNLYMYNNASAKGLYSNTHGTVVSLGEYSQNNTNHTTLNTFHGRIIKGGFSTSWQYGRDNAMVGQTTCAGYSPMLSLKTTNGSWDFGAYDNASYADQAIFSFMPDDRWTAGPNSPTMQIALMTNGQVGYIDGFLDQITKDYISGYSTNGNYAIFNRATRMIHLNFNANLSTSLNAGGTYGIVTLPSVFRPGKNILLNAAFPAQSNLQSLCYYQYSTGKIMVRTPAAIPSGAEICIWGSYWLDAGK